MKINKEIHLHGYGSTIAVLKNMFLLGMDVMQSAETIP